jgi:hypothetical protein
MVGNKVTETKEAASSQMKKDVFATARQTIEARKANFTVEEFAELLQAYEAMEAEYKKCCCNVESRQKSKLNKD